MAFDSSSEESINLFGPQNNIQRKAIPTSDETYVERKKNSSVVNVCDVCGKRFTQKKNLVQHYTHIHEGVRPFHCSICEKRFTRKSDLKNHVSNHPIIKHYSCEQCNVIFSQEKELKVHLRMHRVDIVYTCEVCKATFSVKRELKVHLRSHLIAKVYSCDQCEAVFSDKKNLKVHERSHLIAKVYSCDQCDTTFSRKKDLKVHLSTHSIKNQHSCEQCEEKFSDKSDLIRHIRLIHSKADSEYKIPLPDLPSLPTSEKLHISHTSALNRTFVIETFVPKDEINQDLMIFFAEIRSHLLYKLIERLHEKKVLKWYIVTHVLLNRTDSDGEIDSVMPHFRSHMMRLFAGSNISEDIEKAMAKVTKSFEEFTQRGSGWTIEKILKLELNTAAYGI